jgi:peptidoglycan/xylan/chitin deacetylase (PgdA/CDA1 family)
MYRQAIARPYWLLLSALNRRTVSVRNSRPLVSFSFDDFPRSAFTVGGRILESYQARGTFYAAIGLMNRTNELGELFNAGDLEDLVGRGHELGGHTAHHVSCWRTSLNLFEQEIRQGQEAVQQISHASDLCNFSYPFGHVTIGSKRVAGRTSRSCRGIRAGINGPKVDLNLLRANPLYSTVVKFSEVDRLIAENARLRGWLIFYTHEVCENPSPVGCTPQYFDAAVRCAASSGAKIVTVAQALAASSREGVNGDGQRYAAQR